jgi:hypothetical protein
MIDENQINIISTQMDHRWTDSFLSKNKSGEKTIGLIMAKDKMAKYFFFSLPEWRNVF